MPGCSQDGDLFWDGSQGVLIHKSQHHLFSNTYRDPLPLSAHTHTHTHSRAVPKGPLPTEGAVPSPLPAPSWSGGLFPAPPKEAQCLGKGTLHQNPSPSIAAPGLLSRPACVSLRSRPSEGEEGSSNDSPSGVASRCSVRTSQKKRTTLSLMPSPHQTAGTAADKFACQVALHPPPPLLAARAVCLLCMGVWMGCLGT